MGVEVCIIDRSSSWRGRNKLIHLRVGDGSIGPLWWDRQLPDFLSGVGYIQVTGIVVLLL